MAGDMITEDVKAVRKLISDRAKAGERVVVGIAGPPASGKSTLAEAVVNSYCSKASGPPVAALLPMDGYHLDNGILEKRGLLQRKGAPQTFDVHGFCGAVAGLKSLSRETYFPRFDRKLDVAVANAVVIHPKTEIIVVEGNYLLLKTPPWSGLKDYFTASVFIAPPHDVLRTRLYQRWIGHGLEPKAAAERAAQNDIPNADLVVSQSAPADLCIT